MCSDAVAEVLIWLGAATVYNILDASFYLCDLFVMDPFMLVVE